MHPKWCYWQLLKFMSKTLHCWLINNDFGISLYSIGDFFELIRPIVIPDYNVNVPFQMSRNLTVELAVFEGPLKLYPWVILSAIKSVKVRIRQKKKPFDLVIKHTAVLGWVWSIGPYFLDGDLTGPIYFELLREAISFLAKWSTSTFYWQRSCM